MYLLKMRSEPVKILATRRSNHDQHLTVSCDIQLLGLLFNMLLESKIMYMSLDVGHFYTLLTACN